MSRLVGGRGTAHLNGSSCLVAGGNAILVLPDFPILEENPEVQILYKIWFLKACN